mmetsp:Transcript_11575/g.33681  ORF Transcript_11575/g.33681 Transcript_11575/m.33681 type:complete len:236 (-) Transcript_11575:39-746(-)
MTCRSVCLPSCLPVCTAACLRLPCHVMPRRRAHGLMMSFVFFSLSPFLPPCFVCLFGRMDGWHVRCVRVCVCGWYILYLLVRHSPLAPATAVRASIHPHTSCRDVCVSDWLLMPGRGLLTTMATYGYGRWMHLLLLAAAVFETPPSHCLSYDRRDVMCSLSVSLLPPLSLGRDGSPSVRLPGCLSVDLPACLYLCACACNGVRTFVRVCACVCLECRACAVSFCHASMPVCLCND